MNTSAAAAPPRISHKNYLGKMNLHRGFFAGAEHLRIPGNFFPFFHVPRPSPVCLGLNTRLSGGNGQQHLGNCIQLTAPRTPASEFVSFVSFFALRPTILAALAF